MPQGWIIPPGVVEVQPEGAGQSHLLVEQREQVMRVSCHSQAFGLDSFLGAGVLPEQVEGQLAQYVQIALSMSLTQSALILPKGDI